MSWGALLALLGVLLLSGLHGSVAAQARANDCRWVIVGYQHPFDTLPKESCNLYGCSTTMIRVPCQHPIWECR